MGGERVDLPVPQVAPAGFGGWCPIRGFDVTAADVAAVCGADHADAALDGSVFEGAPGGFADEGGALGAVVGHELGGALVLAERVAHGEGFVGGEGDEFLAANDLLEFGFGSGGMDVDGLGSGDGEGVGGDGFDPAVVRSGLDGHLDERVDACLELGEEGVLFVDGEGEEAVEELRHGREFVLEDSLVDDLEAGGVLEALEAPSGEVSAPYGHVGLSEGGPCVVGFEVVAGAEEGASVGAHCGLSVALSAGDGSECVEAPGDGGYEAALSLDVGGDGPEEGRCGLVGSVGASEALYGDVGAPSGFKEVVDAPVGVGAGSVGVVAAAGSAGHGEDEDFLPALHEVVGFGEVGGGRPGAQGEAFAAAGVGEAQDAPRPSGDFGDGVVPEAVDQLVESGLDRREGGEFLDERVAGGDGFLAEDGVSVAVDGGPAHEGSAFVGEGFVESDGEGVAQVVEDVFARREVDGDVVPFVGGDFGDAAVHEGLAGGDDLDDASASVREVVVDGSEERGALHGGEQVAEEPLFGAFEGGEGGGFGGAVEGPGPVPVAGVSDDAGGLEGVVDVAVDDLEGSGVCVVDAALLGGEGVFEDIDLDAPV